MTTDRKDNENRFSRLWKDKDLTNAFFLGMLAGILLLALALGFWVKSGLAKAARFEKVIPVNLRGGLSGEEPAEVPVFPQERWLPTLRALAALRIHNKKDRAK